MTRRWLYLLGMLTLISSLAAPVSAKNTCTDTRAWGATSTIELPPGYWTPGVHTYQIAWDGQVYWSNSFVVDENAPLYQGQVLIRFNLQAADKGEIVFPSAINPAQDTAFHLIILGPSMDNSDREGVADFAGTVKFAWDGSPFMDANVGAVRAWCGVYTPARTIRHHSAYLGIQ